MKAWHFIGADRLMARTGTPIRAGETYRVPGPVVLCEHGLHASIQAIDALKFAPGPVVCHVVMSGEIVTGDDKCVATERRVIWMADATATLRWFARQCALEVAHLWDIPEVVKTYLETGDAELRDAARDAAWAAASAAANASARFAASASASASAGFAAWDSAWDAWAAASAAARSEPDNRLEPMLLALAPAAMYNLHSIGA